MKKKYLNLQYSVVSLNAYNPGGAEWNLYLFTFAKEFLVLGLAGTRGKEALTSSSAARAICQIINEGEV